MKFIILPFIFTIIIALMAMLFFAKLSHENTIKYNESSRLVINIKDDNVDVKSRVYLSKSKNYIFLYFIPVLAIGSVLFFIEKSLFLLFISIISIFSLSLSTFSPLLLIVSERTDVTTLSLHQEALTFIEIIDTLIEHGDYFLTLVLVFVALLIPFIKSSIILIFNILYIFGEDCKSYNIIKNIGIWSIVDILILVFLIGFCTIKGISFGEIVVESGLYFFIIYLFLSLISIYQLIHLSDGKN